MSRRELEAATATLEAAGVPSPRTDAELLLSYVTGVPRGLLTLMARVDEVQRLRYLKLIEDRAQRVPLQYLTGRAAFRRLDLEVGPGVFIPRPETELLVGWVLEQLAGTTSPVVVDLCTGSGAIALSILDELPQARVHAVERDELAYGWAFRNLDGSGIDLRLGDFVDAFDDLNGTVDVVVSNPPYIPEIEADTVEPEARQHDPQGALFSGPDGLDAIGDIERVAGRLLKPGGRLAIEHAESQHDAVLALFSEWNDVVDHEDLAGRWRFVTASRP